MHKNKDHPEKPNLHPRNRNRERYDLDTMAKTTPELSRYIQPNKRGNPSINFSDTKAVRLLNKSILHHYYDIAFWDFPDENLTPPIPGRAEYIHRVADLLSESNNSNVPTGANVRSLDIGTGASCIYPIIGVVEYDWNFIGTDIDAAAIASAERIVESNSSLLGKIDLRLQNHVNSIFRGVVHADDKIDIIICNPPFHSSAEEALKGSRRKVRNLTGQKQQAPNLNHAGIQNELIYQGGEVQFIKNMISESKEYASSCLWFSALVSKESHLYKIKDELDQWKPSDIRTLPIRTGNKMSRIVAWTYHSSDDRARWFQIKNGASGEVS